MKVICITNLKGGCGKTTTAINLAAGLARAGKTTLLIDLDPQGAATLGCSMKRTGFHPQIADVFRGTGTLNEIKQPTPISEHLFLAPCDLNLASSEVHLAGQPGKEFIIREALETLGSTFTHVVLDTPPNLGTLTLTSFVAATMVIIPVQCEYYAMEGVSQLETILALLKKRFAHTPDVRVLLTMFDGRTTIAHEVVDDIKNHFHDHVFTTIIPRNVKLAEAPSHGKCIFDHAPTSTGAHAYAAPIQEVMA